MNGPAPDKPQASLALVLLLSVLVGGVIINTSTGQPFTYGDACVERNPHVGHDPDATAAAKTAVKDFLRSIFKLE